MASTPYALHSYANVQELNQRAALSLEIGQYDKAISTLKKTLQLWKERDLTDENSGAVNEACMCLKCSANGWICSGNGGEYIDESSVSRPVGHRSPAVGSDIEYRTGFDCGYMYQKLVRIPCRNCFGSQNMGSAVALIIIFNLAIAHHISSSRSNSWPKMKRTLQLYQLANDCLNRYIIDTHSYSASNEMYMMFQMILLNNLSHLHSFMGDYSKSRQCIERLIPIIMCVVDDKNRNIECRSVEIGCISLEGFFQNISPFVLTAQCADAAWWLSAVWIMDGSCGIQRQCYFRSNISAGTTIQWAR